MGFLIRFSIDSSQDSRIFNNRFAPFAVSVLPVCIYFFTSRTCDVKLYGT